MRLWIALQAALYSSWRDDIGRPLAGHLGPNAHYLCRLSLANGERALNEFILAWPGSFFVHAHCVATCGVPCLWDTGNDNGAVLGARRGHEQLLSTLCTGCLRRT